VLALSYLLFVVLGLPDGLLGAFNPAIRAEFSIGTDAWAWILLAGTAGYIISTSTLGKVMARFSFTTILTVAAIIRAAVLLGYAVMPAWLGLIALGFTLGFFAGYIDAGLNVWFAMRFSTREMNWLHAAFGIGMTAASLLAGLLLANALNWRVGYVIASLATLALGIAIWLTRRSWAIPAVIQNDPGDKTESLPIAKSLRLPAVWLLIALFFLTGGMEMTSGNWASSLYAERGVPIEQAAFWVAVYWATFTIGRIFYGIVKVDAYITAVLRGSMIAALLGAILLAWAPTMWVGLAGLGIIGFALAPLIPLLTSETPLRIGRRHAENSIGIQYSGAGLGIAALPALAGIWAAHSSLEVVPVVLIGIAVVMIVAHEVLARTTRRRAQAGGIGARD